MVSSEMSRRMWAFEVYAALLWSLFFSVSERACAHQPMLAGIAIDQEIDEFGRKKRRRSVAHCLSQAMQRSGADT